jgi:hypothetical protein
MNTKKIITFVIFVILLATQVVAASVFIEDFNDNSINNELWIPSTYGSRTILQEQNQRLEIIFPEEELDEWLLAGSYRSKFSLRGDYDIQIDYSMFNGSVFDNGIVWLSVFDVVGRGNNIDVGDGYAFANEIQQTTDTSGKLRLTRKGDIATGYYYKNGEWISLGSRQTPLHDYSVSFGYNSNGYGYDLVSSPLSIALDSFIINEGQIVFNPVPEPSSILALIGGIAGLGGFALRRRKS